MFVLSVAVLFADDTSPPPEMLTKLETSDCAFASTVTVTVTGGYVPSTASESSLVQLRDASVQVHPVPDMSVIVSPAAILSVTVTAPVVAALPMLPAVIV